MSTPRPPFVEQLLDAITNWLQRENPGAAVVWGNGETLPDGPTVVNLLSAGGTQKFYFLGLLNVNLPITSASESDEADLLVAVASYSVCPRVQARQYWGLRFAAGNELYDQLRRLAVELHDRPYDFEELRVNDAPCCDVVQAHVAELSYQMTIDGLNAADAESIVAVAAMFNVVVRFDRREES